MCGISLCFLPPDADVPATLSRMVGSMSHRGPDSTGKAVEPVGGEHMLGMGHNRLSIIDLTSNGCQPMESRDGRYVLTYNGEVYNYREIASELPEGTVTGQEGDTAVVMAALAAWGPAALEKFNGMWALALYDRHERTLLLSRDRFGKKPLYWHQAGSRFYLASEVKSILAATGGRFRVNPRVAVPFLSRGLLNVSNESFFEGIEQFPPASYQLLRLDGNARIGEDVRRYWSHPFERGEEARDGSVGPADVREVFLDAVRLRLRSDVPLAVLLSGGIDSSAILGGVARLGALDNVTVLSVVSDDPSTNEERFIDAMSQHVHCRTEKLNVSLDPQALLDSVSDACWHSDGPVAGFSPLAHMRLMGVARERGIKVLLTGQGADEQLGGYNKFFYFYLASLLQARRYGAAARTLVAFSRHSNTLQEFRLREAMRYISARRLTHGTFIGEAYRDHDTLDIGFNGSFARREWIDLTRTSVPALLHNEDRMSMSQSVEMRVPFLDYRLVELLARVTPDQKFEGGWTKSIFRKAIADLVPPEIQYRRDKKGFSVPEQGWMQHTLRRRLEASFNEELLSERLGFIDGQRLRTLYERFADGRGSLGARQFFRAHAFEVFLRRFEGSIAA